MGLGLVVWGIGWYQFGDWQGLRWPIIVIGKSEEGWCKLLGDMGFASKVELVVNGRMEQQECFLGGFKVDWIVGMVSALGSWYQIME